MLVVAVTALVVATVSTDDAARTTDGAAPTAPTAQVPRPLEEPVDDVRALALPQPTAYLDGVPIGYPRTTAGAVAAAYGYSRIASGLDIDLTLRAIELIADPTAGWFGRARTELADGLVAQRRGLGLAAVGSPAGASLTITPAGYQVIDQATPGQVHVLTLNVVSARATDGTRTSGTVVLDWKLRWDGQRWRATAPYDGDAHDAIAVTPLTTAARDAGWQVAHGG